MPTSPRFRIAALSALSVLTVAGVVRAQFSPPTCVPPNCNPAVIQNVALTSSAQVASINITGDGGIGAKFETGRQAPTFSAATDYLYYGNVNGASTAGYLLTLQQGGADRMKVSISGQQQLPLGSMAAPSYSFIGDSNTGLYSSGADSFSAVTNGQARTIFNNSGTIINSGVLTLPAGSAAAPSMTFVSDNNTGISRTAPDTFNISTNGISRFQIDPAGAVTIPGNLTVSGTFSSTGGLGGDGSLLTNLNASNVSSGTLNDARLSTNVATYSGGGTFTGANTFSNASNSFTGNGAGLTSLNASNISSGTLADARLSTNVSLLNANQTFTGANTFSNASNSFTGSGAGLTSLNASNISSGTLADARLSSNVALYNANGTFTGNNGFTGMTSLGSAVLVVGAGQNMLYGVADTTSAGNLMLLQSENAGVFTDRFRVTIGGAVTAASFAGSGASLTSLNASNLSSGTVPSARISGTYSNNLTFSGQTTFGSAAAVVGVGQNLVYGNMDTTSAGNLLLLQNESVDRFRVDAAGNLTLAGTITAAGSLSSGGVNVCLQDGTDCPATLNGSGTPDYLTKFTGAGDTVGDSIIFEDTANGRIGIGTTTPGKKFEVRNGDLGTYSGNISASFGSVSGYVVANGGVGISGQAVGVSTYGAVGSGDTGVAGYGENYGGWFTAADNFGGAAVYAQWTGNAGTLGKALQAYTDRPAATAAYIEATDGTNASTRGLYVSTPYTVGAKALTVIGDSYFSHDTWVNNLSRWSELGADPAGATEGSMAYVNNKFRCFENAAWKDCDTTGMGGSGTANYITKFTAATTLANSALYESGGNIGLGTTSPGAKLHVVGGGSYGVFVASGPSWGVYSQAPIEASGTTFALSGTAAGGAGAVNGNANGAGIVYGVRGSTSVTTDNNSAGVYGNGQNGVFGYSNVANGVGVKAQAYTNADTALNALVSTTVGAPSTRAVFASNVSTTAGSNQGINAQSTGANAGSNIAAYLNASGGASNYALVTVGGYVGFGEQTPLNPVVIGSDGSAALPALSIGAGDDSNTGFFRPGADTIGFSTAGVERMRITSAGDIGIGTTTPSYQLQLHNTSANDARMSLTTGTSGSASGDGLLLQHTGTSAYVWNYENGPLYLGVNNATAAMLNTSGMTVTYGIGTNGLSPSAGYGVRAQGTTMGGYFYDTDGTSYTYLGYSNYGVYTPYAGYFGGKVGIGTTAPYADYLALGNGLGHNKFTLYETSAAYSYGMGVVSGQLSFHIANNAARFAFYTDAAATTEVFTIWGNGDIVAPYNQNGAGSGWISCGQNGGYCYCPNGSFVGVVYHESNTNLAQALQVYCYKP